MSRRRILVLIAPVWENLQYSRLLVFFLSFSLLGLLGDYLVLSLTLSQALQFSGSLLKYSTIIFYKMHHILHAFCGSTALSTNIIKIFERGEGGFLGGVEGKVGETKSRIYFPTRRSFFPFAFLPLAFFIGQILWKDQNELEPIDGRDRYVGWYKRRIHIKDSKIYHTSMAFPSCSWSIE